MTTSGQAVEGHVCTPPLGHAPGPWVCPGCWSEFARRPVACRELGGRVVALWVRTWELPR